MAQHPSRHWIDAHHHLWNLDVVHYEWLRATGVMRFFGDPTPIQRNYELDEFRTEAEAEGLSGSVHIQVGADDPIAEARWVQDIANKNPTWPIVQVVYCDLTTDDLETTLDIMQSLSTVRGVRQIIGRAPQEDSTTETNQLLSDPMFLAGLQKLGERGLSFDLQLIPELMRETARILTDAPDTPVALCHAGSPHDRTVEGIQHWTENLKFISELPNVVCKISGLGMFDHSWTVESIRPFVDTCVDQFTADRVMFGSNFPVDKLTSDYKTLMKAYQTLIPVQLQEQIFRKTAIAFYRFDAATD
ncbi:MAG: amidohydrolase family protein [Aestuariivita sp.]|nr:amidohydrolase family protein [Aestuariivita sp.]